VGLVSKVGNGYITESPVSGRCHFRQGILLQLFNICRSVILLAVVEAIQEENLELAKVDKSVEQIEVATTVDDFPFHETVKEHAHAHDAHDHEQMKGHKVHRKHSIHKTNGVCRGRCGARLVEGGFVSSYAIEAL